jgi:2-amino-4-hydroxy-6-hydroxymethyldihydropteridine diphosphokinase
MKYYLSLGSNLGRKAGNLARARALLEEAGVKIIRASSVYRTQPVDVPDQPWFFNQALEVRAGMSPLVLLDLAKSIEKAMKRSPGREKGPRVIDIDILLAGRNVVCTRRLMVPHARMDRRNFVLIPLKEIAPDAIHPVLHASIRELVTRSGDTAVVRKMASGSMKSPAAGKPQVWPSRA